ncbi:hypothetical protein V8G54_026138 [Vigna mungo]|uniref:Uncharacterized protein n=1 Tax=Vigna mungo TaxID=3915 RepID=A0AAQ3RLW4_VIGMU
MARGIDSCAGSRAECGLHQHSRVFQEVKGLPPPREKEHRITLKEGVDSVNVRPYQYPHRMKEELERQVADMTKAGIIRPSTSPFSSPVILVKKKGWKLAFLRGLSRTQ